MVWITVPGASRSLRDLPQLLDADRVQLRRAPFVQRQPPHELLGEVAAHAVGEDRDLGANVDARLERRLRLAVLVDAAVAGAHADDAVALVQHLARGEAGEEVDALGLDQPAQPLHEAVERDDVVAVVLERRRRDREAAPCRSRVRK